MSEDENKENQPGENEEENQEEPIEQSVEESAEEPHGGRIFRRGTTRSRAAEEEV